MIDILDMDSRIPVSLDIETSGKDPSIHRILSISLAGHGIFTHYDIRYIEDIVCDEEAMKVNKISKNVLKSTNRTLMKDCVSDLEKILTHDNYMLIGFNVGTFDRQFLERDEFFKDSVLLKKFGFRFVDLNSVIYVIAKQNDWKFYDLKFAMESKAIGMIRRHSPKIYTLGKHNSLFDAYLAYFIFLDLFK